VLEPGSYELWEDLDVEGWTMIESGAVSVPDVPLAVTYAGKLGTLFSKPPLLDLAHLNLTHYQRHADLIHALHVAAQPILVLKAWDDQTDPIGLSVNNALAIPPEGDAFYVEPVASGWDAQRQELERRRQLFGDPDPASLRGRPLRVVDDGVATGMTLRAALISLRRWGPASLQLAVPVADRQVLSTLAPLVERCTVLAVVSQLEAVGSWYRCFEQLCDAEVLALLAAARRG
jgi:hypothetical protein